jgi:hypothetical protein
VHRGANSLTRILPADELWAAIDRAGRPLLDFHLATIGGGFWIESGLSVDDAR